MFRYRCIMKQLGTTRNTEAKDISEAFGGVWKLFWQSFGMAPSQQRELKDMKRVLNKQMMRVLNMNRQMMRVLNKQMRANTGPAKPLALSVLLRHTPGHSPFRFILDFDFLWLLRPTLGHSPFEWSFAPLCVLLGTTHPRQSTFLDNNFWLSMCFIPHLFDLDLEYWNWHWLTDPQARKAEAESFEALN